MISLLKRLFVRTRRTKPETVLPFGQRIARSLADQLAATESSGLLSQIEIQRIVGVISNLSGESFVVLGPVSAREAVAEVWSKQVSLRQYLAIQEAKLQKERGKGVLFSRARLRWSFVFGDDFAKNIERVDRKLQGRVLEAITRITAAPLTPVGDTVKPLTGDLRGLWRYRIGDYRLIYDPDPDEEVIILLSFDARGDVY